MSVRRPAKNHYRPYKIYLCGPDEGPLRVPLPDCPNAAAHTPCPDGYLAWHEWAETKGKTHETVRCEGCGRLTIWKLKGAA